jgi:hypothetical protein
LVLLRPQPADNDTRQGFPKLEIRFCEIFAAPTFRAKA